MTSRGGSRGIPTPTSGSTGRTTRSATSQWRYRSTASGDHSIARTTLDERFRLQRLFPAHSGLPKALRHVRVFFGAGSVDTDTAGSGRALLFGLVSPHRRPTGDVDVTTHDKSFGKCYSGDLSWNVRRGAHVTLPPPGP